MTRIAVITQAETIYDANVGRFFVFVTFTTVESPNGYHCWFEMSNVKGAVASKEKLMKLLEVTSAKSIEDMRTKLIKVQTIGSTMIAFSHINKGEWTSLCDFEKTE